MLREITPWESVSELRFLYCFESGFSDIENGKMADVIEMGILESFMVKYCMLNSASEAAEQILRVDDIIKCAPRPRAPDNRPC